MNGLALAGRTVCIVDDDELVRKNIAAQLSQHAITVLEAADSSDLFGHMSRTAIDCILMDVQLGAENGLFVQAQLRDRFVDIPPIVVLSASENQRTIIKAFRSGASDYLIKSGLRIEELLQTLHSVMDRRAKDQAVTKELESLKRQSMFDEITGFYRREAIETMLGTLVVTAAKINKGFCVLLIRIDQYDSVSEQAGQVTGRRLMRAAGLHLKELIRSVDACGRLDDRTFILLMDTAATVGEREAVIERLDRALRFHVDLQTISLAVSASFAMALYPDNAADPVGLVSFAENGFKPSVGAVADLSLSKGDGDGGQMRDIERRQSQRRRVFKNGKIVLNAGQSVVDCMVRDLSPSGARLRLAGVFAIPVSFELLVVGSGGPRPVQRVWQRSNEIGVTFTD